VLGGVAYCSYVDVDTRIGDNANDDDADDVDGCCCCCCGDVYEGWDVMLVREGKGTGSAARRSMLLRMQSIGYQIYQYLQTRDLTWTEASISIRYTIYLPTLGIKI
jgi:hypothetical protein